MVEANKLGKKYMRRWALRDVDLVLEKGRIFQQRMWF